ncbi:hypothetical protein [Kistimonas scapharcae]|uniref:hypothetical protein n=1 Tax=Kistimonas scapharcae TaxID=1036133 RepID=UPI0031EFE7D9
MKESLPDKALVRRNAKRYRKLSDIPPSLQRKRPRIHHLSKDFLSSTLKRADDANGKIQNLKAKHLSKAAQGGHKQWVSDDLQKGKHQCQVATQKLTDELQALISDAKSNNPPSPDSFKPAAKCALRSLWLRNEIISHTKSKRITQSLPEGIEKALKTKQKKSKDIMQLTMTGQDMLETFNTGMSGFAGLLATTRLFLASLPDDMSKSDFKLHLVQSPSARDKEKVMYHDEYPQTLVKTELFRKVTTKMNNLRKCLDGDDLKKLNSLYEGKEAQIGGIDFIGHADGRALKDDFSYTRDVINQLQQHLVKLQDLAEELSVKYGLDSEYF